ncbi:AraC family transcriptional regulator [Pseudonocardia kujensis]|uniref:AraC family transcriptional regulator n=1 Tax=Pseudonocardia kujensis TaxID=1128675 RepID=UPI001E401EFD|nr:AraC family transcriptional regulator [Pseudonocardia kujensis]MCE0764601.1 AraC family transcriptional regulator [Pseudonocardia kujensis]
MSDSLRPTDHERLAAFRAVRTRDVTEAETRLARVFSPHSLRPNGPAGRFHARANTVGLSRLRLVYLALGTAMTINPDPLSYYAANIVLRGGAEYRQPSSSARSGGYSVGAVLGPGVPTEMRLDDDCEQLSVLVDRQALESCAGLPRARHAQVRLAMSLDLRSAATRSWIDLVRWTIRDAEGGRLLDNPLAAARVEDLIMMGLLTAQRLDDHDDEALDSRLPAQLARAVELIHEHADRPLTLTDLAEAAGTSVRTLQAGFRRHLDTSPSAYLRNLRLDRTREDLEGRAEDDPAGVTTVALRWGFTHVPRFAALYRQRFGELPSETLRRRRRG